MSDLIKIREMSLKYDITARTLKYYEEIGLITSTRSNDYAYRMYDVEAVKRIEQILILRKLNISIKDIQRIFNTSGSEVVLEVLSKKAKDIDDEIALLHELKKIVLEFVSQIKQADFKKDSDVKMLYEKASEIENQIATAVYSNNTSNVNRLLEVTEKLEKLPAVHIVKIPSFRAVTTGPITYERFGEFKNFRNNNRHLFEPAIFGSVDFVWHDDGKQDAVNWIHRVRDNVTEADTAPYNIINFEGGLYAASVASDSDGKTHVAILNGIMSWLVNTGFEPDMRPGHEILSSLLYPCDEIRKGLGYDQLEFFVPIRIKESEKL